MDYKICIVAPFANMKKLADEVILERDGEWECNVEVSLGDSQTGLEQARLAVERGAEVLISRGGTALLIAEQIAVPVVQIQVTALDILRTIKQVGLSLGVIGVAGFRNVIYECEMLAELLDIPVRVIALENKAETAERIAFAASEGIKVVIGDANSVELARQIGLSGYVIGTGKDAIYKAIKEAELVAKVRRREQERAELLQAIVNSSTDGIVAVDKAARITFFNPAACDIFQVSQAMAVGRSVSEVIPNTRLPAVLDNGVAEMGEVQHLGNKELATKRIPIKIKDEVVGAIASFQDVTQLQRFEQAIRQKLHSKGLVAKVNINQIIGFSPTLEVAKRQAHRYAMSSSTVLITGESGTGKEMFAQSIHNLSSRDKSPFVAVNCAALPENLLESELLGYEEGAFTGAKKGGKQGLFELAHGGTMFLDEIGEMPLALQARLLRVLQEKEVMRLGGDRVIPVDVRVIAATNQNMAELVAKRQFREDLYYRLDILRLYLPPLRDRKGDIPMLVEYFYHKLKHLNPGVKGIAPEALVILEKLSWPGNVRELANLMERALLLSDNKTVAAEDIKSILPVQAVSHQADSLSGEYGNLEEVEKETIEQILREENFNYTRAASRLGINRTTLWRKIQKQNR